MKINQWHDAPLAQVQLFFGGNGANVVPSSLDSGPMRCFLLAFLHGVSLIFFAINLAHYWDVYPDLLKIKGIEESHPIYKLWASLNKRSFRKAQHLLLLVR